VSLELRLAKLEQFHRPQAAVFVFLTDEEARTRVPQPGEFRFTIAIDQAQSDALEVEDDASR